MMMRHGRFATLAVHRGLANAIAYHNRGYRDSATSARRSSPSGPKLC